MVPPKQRRGSSSQAADEAITVHLDRLEAHRGLQLLATGFGTPIPGCGMLWARQTSDHSCGLSDTIRRTQWEPIIWGPLHSPCTFGACIAPSAKFDESTYSGVQSRWHRPQDVLSTDGVLKKNPKPLGSLVPIVSELSPGRTRPDARGL